MKNSADYTVLIVDDEKVMRQMLERLLVIEGFQVTAASSAKEGIELFRSSEFDCVLCDVKLPDGFGVDLVGKFKEIRSSSEVILLTAYGNLHDGLNAIRNGAFDYLQKGEDNERITQTIRNACEKSALRRKVSRLSDRLSQGNSFDLIIGESPALKHCIELAGKVAVTDTTVLITGSTGTGKEVFSKAIHSASRRRDEPFLALNCASFSKELLESELFGYKAGAFTGALKDKKGLIDEVAGGTLMLDEIGEIPQDVQAKLLRVIETNEYFRIGETSPRKADFRLIAATNRDLERETDSGRFRSDLFYRLSAFRIDLPSLNERREDIIPLAEFFIGRTSSKLKKNISGMTKDLAEVLKNHNWKGNIRELRNIVERACILEEGNELTPQNLPPEFKAGSGTVSVNAASLAEAEKEHILKILNQAGGNKQKAAEILDIGLSTLYSKLKEYKIV